MALALSQSECLYKMLDLLELVLNAILFVAELFDCCPFNLNLPDTRTFKILLGVFIICLGGLIWCELQAF
jgi:hypothetical protein